MAIARVGERGSGFVVELDPQDGCLRTTGEGFWSEEVASAFFPTVSEALQAHPKVSRFVFDFRALKPLRDGGQLGFEQLLRLLAMRLHPAVSILTASPLTKLQLLRIVKESGSVAWVQFR